jgi:hypothetical protein
MFVRLAAISCQHHGKNAFTTPSLQRKDFVMVTIELNGGARPHRLLGAFKP